MINTIIITALISFAVYIWICIKMYKRKSGTKILVDFDSVIVNIEYIYKRAEIYVKNNPNITIGEYIGAHITEQEVKPEGIREVLRLQSQFYQLIFVSERDSSVRLETAKILNDWGLKGQLFMNSSLEFKRDLIRLGQVDGLLDWSNQHDLLATENCKIVDFS